MQTIAPERAMSSPWEGMGLGSAMESAPTRVRRASRLHACYRYDAQALLRPAVRAARDPDRRNLTATHQRLPRRGHDDDFAVLQDQAERLKWVAISEFLNLGVRHMSVQRPKREDVTIHLR